jgi:hypothetical protein
MLPSHENLERLKKASPAVYDQLERMYDRAIAPGPLSKLMTFRWMYLVHVCLGSGEVPIDELRSPQPWAPAA